MDMFFFSTSVNTPFFVFSTENITISHTLLFTFSQYGAQDTDRPNYCFPTACVKKGITMSFALTREGIKPVAKGFALALALFQIWFTTGFGVLDGSMMRVMFVSFITVLVFLFIPCRYY